MYPIHKVLLCLILLISGDVYADISHKHDAPSSGGVLRIEQQADGLVQAQLSAPNTAFFGFEYAPATEQEKVQVNAFLAQFKNSENLIQFSPSAECRREKVDIHFDFLGIDSDWKQQARGGNSSGVEIDWRFNCAKQAELNVVDVKLLSAFPTLHRLDVAWMKGKGVTSASLSADGQVSVRR